MERTTIRPVCCAPRRQRRHSALLRSHSAVEGMVGAEKEVVNAVSDQREALEDAQDAYGGGGVEALRHLVEEEDAAQARHQSVR